jgi:hypothetical protein
MNGGMVGVLAIGILLIITGLNGQFAALFDQLNSDLFGAAPPAPAAGTTSTTTPATPPAGPSSFLLWIGSLWFLAIMGNVLKMPQASKLFSTLILLVFTFQQNGLWANLEAAFATPTAAPPTPVGVSGQAETATGQPVAIAGGTAPPVSTSNVSSPFAGSLFGTPPSIAQILGQGGSATPLTTPAPGTGSGGIGSA